MDEVTGGIIRIIIDVILSLPFITGIVGLVKKLQNKKLYVALFIFPIVLVYSMYFSGSFRRAPFSEKNVQELIKIASISYDFEDGISGVSENGTIEYKGFIHDGKVNDLYSDDFIDDLFSCKGTYDDKFYYIGPASSDRGQYWEASCHVGYKGIIAIQIENERYLKIHYKISRKIDKYFGFFYAPPLIRKYSFNTI